MIASPVHFPRGSFSPGWQHAVDLCHLATRNESVTTGAKQSSEIGTEREIFFKDKF